ncbi:tRNA pseudouridine(55) synthase TruB [Paraclostridium bifermentans]|uniref:tRNA pseudouridine synthase B n=1 Tax=Paraclostridium bifermentans TaxID=1490 RepID=A0AA44DKG0_PARBF|nr:MULTISPECIES: tRNA pseudouridine(55) synthase TruB [Paraclostridium]MBN8046511.1 tRNA pseudouridine(55) synthase TruB [Paraclostridium bifermentans]MBZ6004948.1 tRNA pseudouridine(55) synthase TruB [Paraclostridium bifermentans]MDU0295781.1 tRNA pseudouridine(55) synthase TruB [Paraclostridium sp. MRS3W1]NME09420.1 tRNA pseudouridine(55) synthase TruB [Paraclostridium bifermentans]
MNKIVNILKPTGMTSHDVVGRVRKILNIKKVGHTGTLDPDASGVLPICIGKATKVSELILNKDKSYICELTLGITTDTYDSSGEIVERSEVKDINIEKLEKAFDTQRGEIKQIPPMYSALKVNGKRMCDLVRAGRAEEITLKYRDVNIKELNILSFKENKVMFYVKCSKGTYVRSICYDIGKELGCGGHMSFLLRTSSGKFNIDNAITLEQLEELYKENMLDEHLYDIDYVLSNFNSIHINPLAVKSYVNGAIVYNKGFLKGDFKETDEFVRVYSEGKFLGVGKFLKVDGTLCLKSDKLFV